MHAYKPERYFSSPPPRPPKLRKRLSPKRFQHQSRHNRAVFIELGLQTSVNCIFVGVAIAAIANLLSHHISQQEKLTEIRAEVVEAEYRVNQLREDFNSNFDAYASPKLIQEHSEKIESNQRRLIWIEPETD